jgi:hypothetical protein
MKSQMTLIAAAALLGAPAFAQWNNLKTPGIPRLENGKPNLTAPSPRTADGKPDLSGIWRMRGGGPGRNFGYDYDVSQNQPADLITPWARGVRQQRLQEFRKDSPLSHCMPVSVTFLNFRSMIRLVQTPGLILTMHESPNSPHRMIFLDGRELPKDPSPTWLGYSVGRWEGDTLVVNSVGFNDQGWLDVGGNPQTESLRLTERFRRPDFGHLEYEATINDPKVFTKPITIRTVKDYAADTEIMEDVCENERDREHLTGGTNVPADLLAKNAGLYSVGGRDVEVTVSGQQLIVKDPAHARDQIFVARSESHFLSSVSEDFIDFAKDASDAVVSFTRTEGNKQEQGTRKK